MPAIAQGQGTPPVLNLPSSSPSGSPYLVVRTVIEVIDIREDDSPVAGPSTSCRTLDYADPRWSTPSASGSASASTSQRPCTPTTPFPLGPSTRTSHTPCDLAAPAPTNLGSLAASPPPSIYPLTIIHPSSSTSTSFSSSSSSSSSSSISALADSLPSSSTSPPQSTTSRLSDNISKGPRGNVAMVSGAMVAAITVLSAIIVSIVLWYGCHRRARNRSIGLGLGRDLRRTGFQGFNHDRRRNLEYERDQQTSGASGSRRGSSGRVGSGGRRGGEGGEAPEVRLAEVRSDGGESGTHTEAVGSVSSAKGGSSR